jgi:hypothetical protein
MASSRQAIIVVQGVTLLKILFLSFANQVARIAFGFSPTLALVVEW